MGTEKKPQQPEQDKPAREASRDDERRPAESGDTGRNGEPGYGQPDPEVREKKLPDQKW